MSLHLPDQRTLSYCGMGDWVLCSSQDCALTQARHRLCKQVQQKSKPQTNISLHPSSDPLLVVLGLLDIVVW